MKQQITQDEVGLLGELAIAADGIQDAQSALVLAFERRLDVDSWDQEKRSAIETFVVSGGRVPIETFLERLGVRLADG